MAKPDERSDNVRKLQRMVQNTEQQIEVAEEYLSKHSDEIPSREAQQIKQKNENRRESIAGFREEIKDEASDH